MFHVEHQQTKAMIQSLKYITTKGTYIPVTDIQKIWNKYIAHIRSKGFSRGITGTKEDTEFLIDHILPRIIRHRKNLRKMGKGKKMLQMVDKYEEAIMRFRKKRKAESLDGRSIHVGARVTRGTEAHIKMLSIKWGTSKSDVISRLIEMAIDIA